MTNKIKTSDGNEIGSDYPEDTIYGHPLGFLETRPQEILDKLDKIIELLEYHHGPMVKQR